MVVRDDSFLNPASYLTQHNIWQNVKSTIMLPRQQWPM